MVRSLWRLLTYLLTYLLTWGHLLLTRLPDGLFGMVGARGSRAPIGSVATCRPNHRCLHDHRDTTSPRSHDLDWSRGGRIRRGKQAKYYLLLTTYGGRIR